MMRSDTSPVKERLAGTISRQGVTVSGPICGPERVIAT